MCRVKVNGKILYAKSGELLSELLIKNGFLVEHPCSGRGTCKKCAVSVNGEEKLSCQYKINSDIEVVFKEENEIESLAGEYQKGRVTEKLEFCLDLGTTTLALALVSLDEKKIIDVKTAVNPQIAYGADVMSRIDYASKKGVEALQSSALCAVNELILSFNLPQIEKLTVAGNTTMLHVFFGVNPKSLGTAPYTPVFLDKKCESSEDLGIIGVKKIYSLPSVDSFAGSDLVAGINFADKPAKDKYNLLVDLGTNAEIALYSQNEYLCTSAAAGPCFEGANISCGMSATEGAISEYSLDGEIKTISSKKPIGICGTGLVDIISVLLEKKIIDKMGFMGCEKFEIAEGVFVTQEDIRQYQMAKSAIYSAICALVKNKNITFDDIERIYISGGFSSKINISNAVKTGLLPKELKEKCISLGNSSLLGAVKFVCENNDLTFITQNANYLDLSLNTSFADLFIKNMTF